MAHNRIFSIYCSKEDCITISKDKKKVFSEIYLETLAVKSKPSLKKICKNRNKRYPLEKGDYVIAIDHLPSCVFDIDYERMDLIHFQSLQHFYDWLNEKEDTKQSKGGGSIDCRKKH